MGQQLQMGFRLEETLKKKKISSLKRYNRHAKEKGSFIIISVTNECEKNVTEAWPQSHRTHLGWIRTQTVLQAFLSNISVQTH